jgi:hypothetical protein
MKPTLLLSDEPEIVRLMLKEITSGGMAVRKSEARAGCNCDRWGPSVPWISRAQKTKPTPTLRFHHKSNSDVIDGISNCIQRCSDDDSVHVGHRSLPAKRVNPKHATQTELLSELREPMQSTSSCPPSP